MVPVLIEIDFYNNGIGDHLRVGEFSAIPEEEEVLFPDGQLFTLVDLKEKCLSLQNLFWTKKMVRLTSHLGFLSLNHTGT